ncbi:UNVERIFIED_ORG: hypothetical protein B2H93_08235 [Clostridium botulinum]
MSFFNSVVSAVVGAVAAVANAIGSAVKSIVSAVSGNSSQAAVGMASQPTGGMAVLGAVAIMADVFEDGEIDEDEEELLEEAFKLLVGAFIFPFDSGSSSTENDDISSDHVCYIFYQPGIQSGDHKHSFDEQAEIEKEKYKKKYPGTDPILRPVTNSSDFKREWDNMDDKSKTIDAVQIILHGSIDPDIDDDDYKGAGFMYFHGDEGKEKEWCRIGADKTVIHENNKNKDILISDLEKKKMNELYFSSCNSANPDAQNTASAFENVVDANEITGWDGGTVYAYNDEKPEKSEEVAGGEGSYKDEDTYGVLPENSLAPAETTGQPTWWRYVPRDSEGWPIRKRQGKVRIK